MLNPAFQQHPDTPEDASPNPWDICNIKVRMFDYKAYYAHVLLASNVSQAWFTDHCITETFYYQEIFIFPEIHINFKFSSTTTLIVLALFYRPNCTVNHKLVTFSCR